MGGGDYYGYQGSGIYHIGSSFPRYPSAEQPDGGASDGGLPGDGAYRRGLHDEGPPCDCPPDGDGGFPSGGPPGPPGHKDHKDFQVEDLVPQIPLSLQQA